ncbi:hypothetical protein BZG36_01640 [Bifiguratus adelaidae]|uniref:UDENN FLCN/SMCR8-type domain-containing protein n=1 Tax=Bifiguratus adelaidae TaxID=1938954 RepID=A0A261Y4R5_9FUNG|nr:hypothetical protein BZG36_01640 [Bifiguratus adelaidae]
MNALVAFLHFCEADGHQIVFCTQVSRASHTRPKNPSSTNSQERSDKDIDKALSPSTSPFSSTPPRHNILSTGRKTRCLACIAEFPAMDGVESGMNLSNAGECAGMITTDPDDATCEYVSTREPSDPEVYAALRKACIRGLSVEYNPRKDGPVLHGDEHDAYALSYTFTIRDAEARGEIRNYSITMLATDRVYLAGCWTFIEREFRSMVINLQARANYIYRLEKEAQRERDDPRGKSTNLCAHSKNYSTSKQDIFVQIHAQFSYILKAAGRLRIEKVIQGKEPSDEESPPEHEPLVQPTFTPLI